MRKFLASRAAFNELQLAVENAASGNLEEYDILVKFADAGQEFAIGEVRFIAPDSVAFCKISKDNRRIPAVIVPEGKEFLAFVDASTKSVGSRIITKFTDAPAA